MKSMLIFVFVLILTTTNFIHGQYAGSGVCPSPRGRTDVDASRFQGTWYVVADLTADLDDVDQKCSRWHYTHGNDGVDRIGFSSVLEMSGSLVDFEGEAKPYGGLGSPDFDLTFPPYALIRHANVTIVDTDYEHYAVQWSCQRYGDAHVESVWILSRTPVLDEVYEMRAESAVRQYIDIPSDAFEMVDQHNCPGRSS